MSWIDDERRRLQLEAENDPDYLAFLRGCLVTVLVIVPTALAVCRALGWIGWPWWSVGLLFVPLLGALITLYLWLR